MHRLLFEVREQLNVRTDPIGLHAAEPTPAVWEHLICVSVIVHRDTELFEMVRAFRPPRSLAGGLHRGQEQRNQNANDGNDNKQLDQRKAGASPGLTWGEDHSARSW